MLCKEIIDVIEHTYPKHAACEWDNVGLLVGRTDKIVNKIYVALDATDAVIDEAIKKKVDMIITHHPLIFSPLKKITDEHFIGSRVVKLLQHDISYYAMHTNYDALGMAHLSGVILGLNDMDELAEGVGCVGTLFNEITVKECAELVKERFHLDTVRVFGDLNKKVKRLAITPGSGSDFVNAAVEKGADAYITGDIGHHDGIDAVAQGVAIIDAGHYGLEHIFIKDMAEYLKKNTCNVLVEMAEIMHPFQVV